MYKKGLGFTQKSSSSSSKEVCSITKSLRSQTKVWKLGALLESDGSFVHEESMKLLGTIMIKKLSFW